jgi:hypothetical protein
MRAPRTLLWMTGLYLFRNKRHGHRPSENRSARLPSAAGLLYEQIAFGVDLLEAGGTGRTGWVARQ